MLSELKHYLLNEKSEQTLPDYDLDFGKMFRDVGFNTISAGDLQKLVGYIEIHIQEIIKKLQVTDKWSYESVIKLAQKLGELGKLNQWIFKRWGSELL